MDDRTQWLILALDGADERLVTDFGCEAIQLETYGACETFAYSFPDRPYTGDVWPTVATGVGPEDHGIHARTESEWSNPVLDVARRGANRLGIDGPLRSLAQDLVDRRTTETRSLRTTDASHIFEGPDRAVHNWPGVYRPEFLSRLWDLLSDVNDGAVSAAQFQALARGECREKLAWAAEVTRGPFSLVGCHVHYLDLLGHVHSKDETGCRDAYRWFDEQFGAFLETLPDYTEVVLLSDHGINVAWLDDADIGDHSWRAISASTTDERPTDVTEVRAWLEERLQPIDAGDRASVPEDRLRDLGYL